MSDEDMFRAIKLENHNGGRILVSDEDVFRAVKLVLISVKFLTVSVVRLPASKTVVSMEKSWQLQIKYCLHYSIRLSYCLLSTYDIVEHHLIYMRV